MRNIRVYAPLAHFCSIDLALDLGQQPSWACRERSGKSCQLATFGLQAGWLAP
jgi:hypothetical protein